jgi:hypothetical protein
MVLQKNKFVFTQILDYYGVPYKCVRFQRYGHLVDERNLSFHKSNWR